MGHKIVCLDCKIAFNHDLLFVNKETHLCPQCGKKAYQFSHRFRPPRKQAKRKWEVVKFYVENGFFYHHIVDENYAYQTYPETLHEAKEFVEKYKNK